MIQTDMCIIGCGVSGISMSRTCKANNLRYVCLEKEDAIGGCWYTKSYENIILQTTKESYAFHDMPMSKETKLYPSGISILNYLHSYVKKYKLLDNIIFNSEVIDIEKKGEYHRIKYKHSHSGVVNIVISKYISICSGFYTTPKYPKEIGNINKSYIKHIIDFSPKSKDPVYDFKDKSVVIIGNGPSGCDLAVLAIEKGAKDVSLLYRSPKWIFTRYFGNIGLNFFTNRLFLWLGLKLPITLFITILYLLFFIPYYAFGNNVNLELPSEIVNRNNITLNEKFILYLNNNKFKYIKIDSFQLDSNQITYKTTKGQHIKTFDLLTCCTGYNIGIPFMNRKKIPVLYKKCLDPIDPTIAYIGFSPSFNWVQVSDLQSRWFVYLITNKSIPNTQERLKYIKRDLKENMGYPFEFYDLAYLSYIYSDDLARDMNIYPKSKKDWMHWLKVAKYNEWS